MIWVEFELSLYHDGVAHSMVTHMISKAAKAYFILVPPEKLLPDRYVVYPYKILDFSQGKCKPSLDKGVVIYSISMLVLLTSHFRGIGDLDIVDEPAIMIRNSLCFIISRCPNLPSDFY